jgi:hypothetical protein
VQSALTYAARDRFDTLYFYFDYPHLHSNRHNRDVVIKVVAKGDSRELQILLLLNSQPLRSHPANQTIEVLDFLNYEDYHFTVMPMCDESQEPAPRNVDECLEFAEQIISVGTPGTVLGHY